VIVDEYPEACLVLVGEGGGDQQACEEELRRSVAIHNLATSVRFTGAVDNVEDWLRAADIFAFPTHDEAFGLSLVEAMACGLPAVSTRVGGWPTSFAMARMPWPCRPHRLNDSRKRCARCWMTRVTAKGLAALRASMSGHTTMSTWSAKLTGTYSRISPPNAAGEQNDGR
jgi:hypothetical protein